MTSNGLLAKKEISIERLIAEAGLGRPKKTAAPMPNLFDKEKREAWYKTGSFGKTGLSVPDAARLERMSANYGHDRAVLAKTDPLFARSEFRDAGHAGGSGEYGYFDKQQLNKIKDMALEFEIRKSGDLIQ